MNETTNGLMDIVEPAAPLLTGSSSWLWPALMVVLVALLMMLALYIWKKKWPAYRAFKRVRQLKLATQAGKVTPQESILQLAQQLRAGMGMPHVLSRVAPAGFGLSDRGLWPVFIQHLDSLRYQPMEDLNYAKLAPLFAQAETWLRRYGR